MAVVPIEDWHFVFVGKLQKKIVFKKILNQIVFRDVKQGTQRGSPGFSQFVLSPQTNANWWKSTAAQRIKDIALASLFELQTSIKINLM